MNRLEKAVSKLSKKEISYIFDGLNEAIYSWYNGDLEKRHRRELSKAINFLEKIFPRPKYNIKCVYRAFENKKELVGRKKLSHSTRPCASFSKDVDGLFHFIKGGGVDAMENAYMAKINIKESDILVDTETLIGYLEKLIGFIKTTKNKQVISIITSDCDPLRASRQAACSEFRDTIKRLKEFNKEKEIIIKTIRPLPITKLVDPINFNNIIKCYLAA
jgi:hypothetical protein